MPLAARGLSLTVSSRSLATVRPVRKALLLALIPAALAVVSPAQAAGPLQTAVYVQGGDIPADAAAASRLLRRIKDAGATAVRLNVSWKEIAPRQRPAVFEPTDPADPAYDWRPSDRAVLLAVENGLTPLVDVTNAPTWAGGKSVNAADLGAFATAIATRYNGSYEGLPARQVLAGLERAQPVALSPPQVSGKKLVGAARYRGMVNAFSTAAHAVRARQRGRRRAGRTLHLPQ